MRTDAVCVIYFEENGESKQWSVGADYVKDTRETIEAHLKRHRPNAVFIGFQMRPVQHQKFDPTEEL